MDYKRLNVIIRKDKYPLPLIRDLRDKLAKVKIFTHLNLKNAFNLIKIKEENKLKIAFKIKYKYSVMPFKLINAPATL